MGNYNVGNETKNGSRGVCKWKGVVCLAGILISLVVGSFVLLHMEHPRGGGWK